MASRVTLFGAAATLALAPGVGRAQEPQPPSVAPRQSQDDAWWTGSMLANSAATLPRGHFLAEPYLYDVMTRGHFDGAGARHGAPHADGFGSLTYLLYGLTDRVSIGLVPVFGFNTMSGGRGSPRPAPGDVSALAQYRLTQVRAGGSMPTISVSLQETLPSGRYDRLGDWPADGLGSGAYTTTLGLYSQTYFWLPNGRILRMRVNLSEALSSAVHVADVSVYGTGEGFRGRARPGSSSTVDASWEYSATRSWVLCFEAVYRNSLNTRVAGRDARDSAFVVNSGSSNSFALAPAIEYSWKSTVGILLGTRIIASGRNAAATLTPAVAINIVR